jgi:ParB family chromosome partitioning protein
MVARKQHFGTGSSRLADVVQIRSSVAPPTIRIPLAQIDPSPRNPRQRLDVDELAASIRAYGLLQPIVVRRAGVRYELVAGHRRLVALQALATMEPAEARWREVEAVVRHANEDQAYLLTLTENLQRSDLAPREEAAALEVLVRQEGWSVRRVAEVIHRDPLYVSRRLRVFDDPILAGPVLANRMPVSTAEIFLRAPREQRAQLVDRALAEGWTQGQARRAVRSGCGVIPHSDADAQLLEHLRAARAGLEGRPVADLPAAIVEEAQHLFARLGMLS